MGRLTSWIVILSLTLGVATFLIKQEVLTMEARLGTIKKTLIQLEENSHVLMAEWAYLNRPDRLDKLASQHLNMAPDAQEQMLSVAQVLELTEEPLSFLAQTKTPAPMSPAPALPTVPVATSSRSKSNIVLVSPEGEDSHELF
jgi:cell division protein FtsL